MGASCRGFVLSLTGVLIVMVCAAAQAREAVVTRTNGATLTGELVSETPETVTLRIVGIDTPIPRKDIEKVEYKKTPLEQYAERKGKLDEDDIDGRFNLALDMFEEKAYDLAMRELRELEAGQPDNEKVKRLITVIEHRQELQTEEVAGSTPPRPTRTDPEPPPVDGGRDAGTELLTNEQVNLIKLWELPADLEQAKPRLVIPRDTIDKLFKDYATEDSVPKGRTAQNQFRSKKPYEQLQLIFDVRARPLYKDIIVRDDPPALAEFRRTINVVYVVRYLRRHFGQEGQVKGLHLFGNRPNQVNEAYTNFYILTTAQHQGLPFIDRAIPQRSLLLQWGLPRDAATHPAPEVEGWRPFFTGLDDPTFQLYVDWIGELYDPIPSYGIDYQWPGQGESAPAPAEAPEPGGGNDNP